MNAAEEKALKDIVWSSRFVLDFFFLKIWISYSKQSRIRSFRSPESTKEQRCSLWFKTALDTERNGGRALASLETQYQDNFPNFKLCHLGKYLEKSLCRYLYIGDLIQEDYYEAVAQSTLSWAEKLGRRLQPGRTDRFQVGFGKGSRSSLNPTLF